MVESVRGADIGKVRAYPEQARLGEADDLWRRGRIGAKRPKLQAVQFEYLDGL